MRLLLTSLLLTTISLPALSQDWQSIKLNARYGAVLEDYLAAIVEHLPLKRGRIQLDMSVTVDFSDLSTSLADRIEEQLERAWRGERRLAGFDVNYRDFRIFYHRRYSDAPDVRHLFRKLRVVGGTDVCVPDLSPGERAGE